MFSLSINIIKHCTSIKGWDINDNLTVYHQYRSNPLTLVPAKLRATASREFFGSQME